ncbi:hypothetical protein KEM52_003601 [Ascosphaera acerosa]|nr:hypothetical protein KEM52_003601 [Ascosphaera acerosa]
MHTTPRRQADADKHQLARTATAAATAAAMKASGFAGAPLAKAGVVAVVAASILATVADCKHCLGIYVRPHLWEYGQLWRLATWQVGGCKPAGRRL